MSIDNKYKMFVFYWKRKIHDSSYQKINIKKHHIRIPFFRYFRKKKRLFKYWKYIALYI